MIHEDYEREPLRDSLYQVESRLIEELSLNTQPEATIVVEGININTDEENTIVRERDTLPF